jgi:hypothetical protein
VLSWAPREPEASVAIDQQDRLSDDARLLAALVRFERPQTAWTIGRLAKVNVGYAQEALDRMADFGVSDSRQRSILERFGPPVVRGVVARLHASTPYGRVVHIHNPLGWWRGRPQPVALSEILDTARHDIGQAIALVARGRGPRDADPRAALNAFAIPIRATVLWRWPFAAGIDYLVCATVAGTPLRPGLRR